MAAESPCRARSICLSSSRSTVISLCVATGNDWVPPAIALLLYSLRRAIIRMKLALPTSIRRNIRRHIRRSLRDGRGVEKDSVPSRCWHRQRPCGQREQPDEEGEEVEHHSIGARAGEALRQQQGADGRRQHRHRLRGALDLAQVQTPVDAPPEGEEQYRHESARDA